MTNKEQHQTIPYQKQLDRILEALPQTKDPGKKPHLLLHVCCAPCSSYVLEYLHAWFRITIFYYNPNITPETEYQKRMAELKRFIGEAGYENQVSFVEGTYDPAVFFSMARGMEELPERSARCYLCYEMRMREAAKEAARLKADYFTTTLSVSPHKDAGWINNIGKRLEEEYGVTHLPSDFKKKSGYLRSITLSKQYHLYRQNYCGCIYSKRAAEKKSEP